MLLLRRAACSSRGAATTTPPLTVDSEVGIISAIPEDSADREEEEEEEKEEDDDELAESTQHSVLPNGQDLFLSLTEVPSQPSFQDHDPMEGTSAANSSSLPPPSQRLSQIRRRKKTTRDERFAEIMESTRSDRAHLNEWKDTVSEYRKEASEREDRRDARDERWRQEDQRRQDTMLGLLREQTDMLRHLVGLQERRQDNRVPLQHLYNPPHHVP
ncbi:AP-3 complex subunit beta-1-like isoform X3 [Malaclemys terrapin pileata]|uniref:AP-3 complex subunit beta-1-like isoform X3 n=1 Tax=Malaclemys terrapin pileata TaxID=2991368 RepID=UPI0023A8234A|nr:AP-3 complex subunit beta-1-like isoform X3 [Malaclemys terrapin pileata]